MTDGYLAWMEEQLKADTRDRRRAMPHIFGVDCQLVSSLSDVPTGSVSGRQE